MTFNNTLKDIEKLFGSTEWTDNGIKTYPQNYQGKIGKGEYVRVNIYQGNSSLRYLGFQNRSGEIVCNIFIPVGKGMSRANEIADLLDNLLTKKNITGLQTTNSYTTNVGIDSVDSGLFRLDYTINFNKYN